MESFTCGWAAGGFGVLVSHPLDTLRVVVQTSSSSRPPALSSLWQTEGISGLSKGLLSPLLGVGLWKAIVFSTNAHTMKLIRGSCGGEPPGVWHHWAAGVAAGATGLVVQTPFERVKVIAQTSPAPPGMGSISHEMCIAQRVLRSEGLSGLYRGLLVNATLGPLAIGIWFGMNEWLMRKVRERRAVGLLEEFACGSIAGTLAWTVNFPSDKAKTIVQAEAGRQPTSSSLELLRPHLRSQGVAFAWRGLTATLLRSIPQTGATIVAYGQCSRMFRRWFE